LLSLSHHVKWAETSENSGKRKTGSAGEARTADETSTADQTFAASDNIAATDNFTAHEIFFTAREIRAAQKCGERFSRQVEP
jgi:hypothetical protein